MLKKQLESGRYYHLNRKKIIDKEPRTVLKSTSNRLMRYLINTVVNGVRKTKISQMYAFQNDI